MLNFFKSIKMNIISSAILCIVLGILLVAYPNMSLTLVCRIVGAIVLVTGLGLVYGYLRRGKAHWYGKIELVFGSILAIVGGFLVLRPLGVSSIIPLICGVLFIYHGLANMRQAFELRQYKDRGWWFPVLVAATTILLGLFIVNNPFETMDMIMRLIGACLIYDGLMNTMLVGRFVKSIRNFRRLEAEEAEKTAEKEIEAEKTAEKAIETEKDVIEGEYKEL